MDAQTQLAEIVRLLTPHADVRPGLAGMITVDRVPMLRLSGGRVQLLPVVVGLDRIDARTVAPHEAPIAVAREILDRRDALRSAAA